MRLAGQNAVSFVVANDEAFDRQVVGRTLHGIGQRAAAVENGPLAVAIQPDERDAVAIDDHGLAVDARLDFHAIARRAAVDGRLNRLAGADRERGRDACAVDRMRRWQRPARRPKPALRQGRC